MLKLYLLWYLAGALMLISVATLSLIPAPDIGVNDKFSHLLIYLILSAWFSLLVVNRKSLAWVIVGLIAYGVAIEGLQGLTNYRYAELGDILANGAGILLGTLIFFTPLYRVMRLLDHRLAGIIQR